MHKNVPPEYFLGKLIRLEKGSYQTSITDLRMMTNYTFSIEAAFRAFPSQEGSYHSSTEEKFAVSVETKGCKQDNPETPLYSICMKKHEEPNFFSLLFFTFSLSMS